MLNFVGGLSSLPILQSWNFWRHCSSNVQSLAYINPIPLFYKKILAGILLSETKTSRYCTFIVFMWYVVTWKAGRHRVTLASKFFFLRSNNVLDAVLSTDHEEQRCFKYLIRQVVSLNKTKVICSVTDRKLFLACGFCV